jgi:hypothetical protein
MRSFNDVAIFHYHEFKMAQHIAIPAIFMHPNDLLRAPPPADRFISD